MTQVRLRDLDGDTDYPELVFGVVAAVGTPWKEAFEPYLLGGLTTRGYTGAETISVSSLLKDIPYLTEPYPPDYPEYERVTKLMNRGNELRKTSGRLEALALMVAARIKGLRPKATDGALSGRAFIVHQLKTPEEVLWLRRTYGDAFHLVGLYSPHADRQKYLVEKKGMTERDAKDLIARDEGEEDPHGQQVRKTFHLADVFIEATSGNTARVQEQVDRFLDLLFGRAIISPTKDEYGMYLAHAVGLRSTDLSRQVGAAVLNDEGDVLGLGPNEVPAAGGGQYWGEKGKPDHRDFKEGYDYNEVRKGEIASEIIQKLEQLRPSTGNAGKAYAEAARDELTKLLDSTPIAHLIEFGRAVHAEMEALLSATRRGVAVNGARLYTTVFPCHNCAKHIVGAGIGQVFYIEPYAKSLAPVMHRDSIWFTDYGEPPGAQESSAQVAAGAPRKWVRFSPFLGVAPRRFAALFMRPRMKAEGGAVSTTPIGLRLRGPMLSLREREALAARAGEDLKSSPS